MKNIGTIIFSLFFVVAGLNHFINPDFYLPLIPPFIPWHEGVNVISGVVEILLGVTLLLPATRKYAALGIIMLMVLFIPSHVYFIQLDGCHPALGCAPLWLAWLRLVVIQPILIYIPYRIYRTA